VCKPLQRASLAIKADGASCFFVTPTLSGWAMSTIAYRPRNSWPFGHAPLQVDVEALRTRGRQAAQPKAMAGAKRPPPDEGLSGVAAAKKRQQQQQQKHVGQGHAAAGPSTGTQGGGLPGIQGGAGEAAESLRQECILLVAIFPACAYAGQPSTHGRPAGGVHPRAPASSPAPSAPFTDILALNHHTGPQARRPSPRPTPSFGPSAPRAAPLLSAG
jgi:hypothetical protein